MGVNHIIVFFYKPYLDKINNFMKEWKGTSIVVTVVADYLPLQGE